jgi:hypothetical protein
LEILLAQAEQAMDFQVFVILELKTWLNSAFAVLLEKIQRTVKDHQCTHIHAIKVTLPLC